MITIYFPVTFILLSCQKIRNLGEKEVDSRELVVASVGQKNFKKKFTYTKKQHLA
jgi:hypothetical protein